MSRLPTAQWEAVQRMLDAALDLPQDQVPAFLDHACRGDPALRHEVEDLLRSCARAGAFLEEPPAHVAAALLDERPASAGRRIGPYVVTGEAGRGGMGVVYLAERGDGQFRQRVALKVLPHALASEQAIRRFLEERQILASLAHPGIARLLDGGVTDDELPYFAMEYVDGTTIDRYCAQQGLSIEARLRLLLQVCDAVQYAHQNLIVHRDLKPSNILVTAEGAVKLLDFGIAKLVSDEPGNPGEPTQTAGRWLTPRYASPEQICGRPVTTVSDVYTLGVLLFELVTGRSPYRLPANTTADFSRLVCEGEVPRPSLVVRRPGSPEGGDHGGEGGGLGLPGFRPERLARRLRGDIDTIVLTAMHKDPRRRYPSAGALAEDLRRHLEGQPVRARPDTPLYRVSKFVRRHRVAVSVGAATLISLVAGITGTAWQGAVARRERAHAQRQAATAARASELVIEMFRLSDPDVARGETITAREILARGTQRVETDFAHDSTFQALMLLELGRIYHNLGLPDDAERLVRRAVDVWSDRPASAELAAGLHLLGETAVARARFADAEPRFRQALAIRRRLHRAAHEDVAASARGIGDALTRLNRSGEAEPLYREALAVERQLHGNDHAHVASTLYALAVSFHDRRTPRDAEPLYQEAVAIYRRIPASGDPVAATARMNLASFLLFRHRYAEAEPLFREAVDLRRQLYPPGHQATVQALSGLGTLLYNTSRFSEAEPVLREALTHGPAVLGDDHPDIVEVRQILGAVLAEQGRHAEADRWLSEALGQLQARSGPDAPLGFIIRILRGENRLQAGRLAAAEADFREVAAHARRRLGPVGTFLALGLRGAARVTLERGQADSAAAELRRALAAFPPGLRRGHHYVLGARRSLAEALARQGRYREADSILADVRALHPQTLAPGHVEIARALHTHGEVRVKLGDAPGGEQLLRDALAIRRAALGPAHWLVAETESALGEALAVQARHNEARPLLANAYARLLAQRGTTDRRTRDARARLNAESARPSVGTRSPSGR